jgi:hypothetical protein
MTRDYFFTYPDTSFVISNMLTLFLPLKAALGVPFVFEVLAIGLKCLFLRGEAI